MAAINPDSTNTTHVQDVGTENEMKLNDDQQSTLSSNNNMHVFSSNTNYNILRDELYKVYLTTRASPQQTKNRNSLLKFIEKCVIEQMHGCELNANTIMEDAVLFGSSSIGIDINGIPLASDIDYAIVIPHTENENKIGVLKNVKQILSCTQITPDFHNQFASSNHYNDQLVVVVDDKKNMKECNKNRRRLLKDRKSYAKNPQNLQPKQYQGGPYSLMLKLFLKPKKTYLMSRIRIMDPCYDCTMDLCAISMDKRDELRKNVKLMNSLLNYNFDDRIRPFLVNVKYWCKMRRIHIPFDGYMNSYCFVLLGIKYLQMIQPSILPVIVDGSDETNKNKLIGNDLNLDQLLIGFFSFWLSFDYVKYEIDICKHGLVEKCNRDRSNEMMPMMVIVNPVNSSHNCANAVIKKGFLRILDEFYRATQLLSQNASWIQSVCIR